MTDEITRFALTRLYELLSDQYGQELKSLTLTRKPDEEKNTESA